MKKGFIVLVTILGVFNFCAAQKKAASPAETATGTINGATITIKYGSPSVKGREIWGGLVPFDQVWRAGANDATTFETDKELTIEGSKLPAGTYSLFVIPNQKECTIIFNKQAKQWGAYSYKEKEDQLRVKVAAVAKKDSTEKLLYTISTYAVTLSWANWDIVLKVK
jgi:hypothetical protein